MNRLTIALLIALVVSSCTSAFAQGQKTESIVITTVIQENDNAGNPLNWIFTLRDGDYDQGGQIIDENNPFITSASMMAMGNDEVVLGKVFLEIRPWDLYEVVVYTNEMDCDGDGIIETPSDWNDKSAKQRQDFIDKHAGLQIQNDDYLDDERFNSNLYGASLKVRSEGIHGTSAKDDLADMPSYWGTFTGAVNDNVPAELWDGKTHAETVEFSPVPELANEFYKSVLPLDDDGNEAGLVKIAGARYNSPLTNSDGSTNWLEVILAASEENTGSDTYSTKVYFELRWN